MLEDSFFLMFNLVKYQFVGHCLFFKIFWNACSTSTKWKNKKGHSLMCATDVRDKKIAIEQVWRTDNITLDNTKNTCTFCFLNLGPLKTTVMAPLWPIGRQRHSDIFHDFFRSEMHDAVLSSINLMEKCGVDWRNILNHSS